MGKRRSSREQALKFLYQSELNEGDYDKQMEQFLERVSSQDKVEEFMQELVQTVIRHKKEIDVILKKCSANWELERMAVVDRNILRIGACDDFRTTLNQNGNDPHPP